MAKEKKEFRTGLYAIIVCIALAVILSVMTIYAFVTRYNAYSPEKVAINFVDTIVQTGDGYDAYKITLVSQNKKLKYGDFLRRGYMVCFVNDGDGVKQADFVGTGNAEEQKAKDGVYNTMYDCYVGLLQKYGWDDYDSMYMDYFAKLKEVRKELYGDDYMDTEYMFGVLEANVAKYGESLTGTERKLASDNKTVIQEETVGRYQEMFGKDYKLTVRIASSEKLSADEVRAYAEGYKARVNEIIGTATARTEEFKLDSEATENMLTAFKKLDCSDSISEVEKLSVEVVDGEGKQVVSLDIYVVAIKGVWYVDNTNTDTSALYLALGK